MMKKFFRSFARAVGMQSKLRCYRWAKLFVQIRAAKSMGVKMTTIEVLDEMGYLWFWMEYDRTLLTYIPYPLTSADDAVDEAWERNR